MNFNLDVKLDEYIASVNGEFRIKDAIAAITAGITFPRGSKIRTEERIAEMLGDDLRLFCGEGKAVFRRDFFHGGNILINPSPWEIEHGILFPGHRFVPFCHSEIFPSEIILLLPDGKTCKTREVPLPLDEVAAYCSLLGADGMYDFLVAENHANVAKLRSGGKGEQQVLLTAFDLSDFYRQCGFRPGDVLLFEVVNWENGTFSIKGNLSSDDREINAAAAWIEKLDQALITICEMYEFYLEVPEQLSRALFLAGAEMLHRPPISLDEYMQQTSRIELGYMSGDTALVVKQSGTDEMFGGDVPEDVAVSQGKTGSLEEILQECGCLLKQAEIEAYMLHQLYLQEADFDLFFQRCFGEEQLDFYDEAQKVCFYNFLEDLWETQLSQYDRFSDEEKGPIRARVLELIQERRDWLRSIADLGIDFEKLREQSPFDDLAAVAVHLVSLCRLLNSGENFVSSSEAEAMNETINRMAELQERCLEELNTIVGAMN